MKNRIMKENDKWQLSKATFLQLSIYSLTTAAALSKTDMTLWTNGFSANSATLSHPGLASKHGVWRDVLYMRSPKDELLQGVDTVYKTCVNRFTDTCACVELIYFDKVNIDPCTLGYMRRWSQGSNSQNFVRIELSISVLATWNTVVN